MKIEEVQNRLEEKVKLYQNVFNDVSGEKVLEDLSNFCYVNNTTMREDGSATQMAFNEGKRTVYLYIKRCMDMDLLRKQKTIIQ